MEVNYQEARAVTSAALAIFIAVGILAILRSLLWAAWAVPVFHISQNYQFAARVIVILAGLNIAVSLISGVFGGVLTALHQFDLSNNRVQSSLNRARRNWLHEMLSKDGHP